MHLHYNTAFQRCSPGEVALLLKSKYPFSTFFDTSVAFHKWKIENIFRIKRISRQKGTKSGKHLFRKSKFLVWNKNFKDVCVWNGRGNFRSKNRVNVPILAWFEMRNNKKSKSIMKSLLDSHCKWKFDFSEQKTLAQGMHLNETLNICCFYQIFIVHFDYKIHGTILWTFSNNESLLHNSIANCTGKCVRNWNFVIGPRILYVSNVFNLTRIIYFMLLGFIFLYPNSSIP